MDEIALHLLDIVQNSIKAKAKNITIIIEAKDDDLVLIIEDDGIGMDKDFLKNVTDPFVTTRTTRKVGLGISLLKQSAETSLGDFHIDSEKGVGTKINSKFKISNIDRIPLGDIAGTMENLIMCYEDVNFDLKLKSINGQFQLSTKEIKETLDGVPINEYDVLKWIKDYINEQIENIFGGVLNEIIERS